MTGGTVVYRIAGYRLTSFVVFGLMACVAAVLVLVLSLSAHTDPQLAGFIVFWLAGFAWNCYWFFFRVAYEIGVVDESTLRWRTIATSHEAPLVRITSINTPFGPFGTGLRRISIESERSPLLPAWRGVGDVIAMITAFRPDVPIKTRWLDRTYQRFAIGNVRWRRVDGGGGG
jgi:hypothetical protein